MEAIPLVGKYNWMKVADVMTRAPQTLSPSDSLRRAVELMSIRGYRHLPVVLGKSLVGIISDRDIRSTVGAGLLLAANGTADPLNLPVASAMTRDPLTLSPDDRLDKAVSLLIEEKIGGLPVVDGGVELLGIVTYIDLLGCFLNRMQEY